jgi:2-keto-4-pentenoate hydratase/2-oxohepta-3-ene-1,7-dioic acid hydratase in catechol pathway
MKILCIGRNYVDHIHELKNELPDSMVIFLKPHTALHDNARPWVLPPISSDVHYECEIVLKINKKGSNICIEEAENYYDEISLGIDFTARDIQAKLKEKGLPWEKAKAFDGAALVGNFVSKNDYNLTDLNFKLVKNDQIVQHGNTNQMIHSFSNIINELSRYFTLEPEDLIYTGTPAGVAAIQSGDCYKGELEGNTIFEFKVC